MGKLYEQMMAERGSGASALRDTGTSGELVERARTLRAESDADTQKRSPEIEAVKRKLPFLEKAGEFFRSAALAPTKSAVGALATGQKGAQWFAEKLGLKVPEKGESVLTDVLVHGGELGLKELQKEQETSGAAEAGRVAGDIGLTMAATADVGKKAGVKTLEAIKKGQLFRSIGQGAISGAKGGGAAGAITAMSEGESPSEVAGQAALGGVAGGAVGGILGGISALAVKGTKTVGDLMKRHRLSTSRKALEESQADSILYGNNLKSQGGGLEPVPLTNAEKAALDMSKVADLNPGDAGLVREATPTERTYMKRMYDLAKKNLGKRAPDDRTIQEPGRVIVGYLQKIDDLRETAGQNLDDAIRAMPDEAVDVSSAFSTFDDFLKGNGVIERVDDVGNVTLDFSKSKRFKDAADVQRHAKSLFDDLREGQLAPEEIIGVRRRLFDILDLGKDQKDIVAPIEGILDKVRDELDAPLAAMSDAYAKNAQEYAMTRKALSDWYKKIGMKFVEGQRPAGSIKAGEIGRRFLGNASADYVDLFDETMRTFEHFGIKPTVDARNLLRFNAALEDLFGTTQTQSLRGQVGGGVSDALSPALDVASGGKTTLLKKGAELVDKATSKTKEAQREAMEQLLNAFISSQ